MRRLLIFLLAVCPVGYGQLALDTSTPVAVTATDAGAGSHTVTLTTASFTPPAGSVVIACFYTNDGNGGTLSAFAITDNLATHLTYTNFASRGNPTNDVQVNGWWAAVSTSAAMTVSASYHNSAGDAGSPSLLRVLVINGANTTSPIGVTSGARGRTTNISGAAAQYSSTVNGSWGWLMYADWTASGIPTVPAGETVDASFNVSGEDSYALIKQSSTTVTAGTTVTMSTSTPTSGLQLSYAYFEIVPSGGGPPPPVTPRMTLLGVGP